MKATEKDDLLMYYERELTYLRKMGVEFARKYPKVAGRLELGHGQSPDPNVERLMEAFAYLTARIQYNIDAEFPEVPRALLNVLYPHYLSPVPTMSVARFDIDPLQDKFKDGYTVAKHTPLFTQADEGQICRFRTCYPTTLWPVEVEQAAILSTDHYDFLDATSDVASVLRIRIRHMNGSLKDLNMKSLRFYLHGDLMLVYALYELIFAHTRRVALLPEGSSKPIYLAPDAIKPVGFGAEEEVLPYARHAHMQYRLIQEYFAFPEKFLFFDVDGLDRNASEKSFDILILLDRQPPRRLTVDKTTFALGCTPIINLFRKTSEPIRLSHLQVEYPLVADGRRESTTEIHTVLSVSASSDAGDETTIVEPFYSFNHHGAEREAQAFWYVRRIPSERRNVPGSEMLLTLVDLNFRPALPPKETIFAHTLCTNRHLGGTLPAGARLQVEEAMPVLHVHSLDKPTQQIDPPLTGSILWRLVSHLSLNYLSLANEAEGLRALREILELYSIYEDPSRHHQILGIREMSCRRVTRRIGREAWRGFCQGTEVTLVLDEGAYVGSSAFMLASVLNHFFALYASINSFTQLVVKTTAREGVWKQWQPMAGEQTIL